MQVEADLLRRVPVTGPPTMIIALGIGQQLSMYELNNMASWPYDRNVIVVSTFGNLSAVESSLSNTICGSEYSTGMVHPFIFAISLSISTFYYFDNFWRANIAIPM